MNLGLITSYIIAGMLMLAIVTMNINLSTSSSELTVTQIQKQHVQTVTDMLTYDIPKIGFAQNGKVTAYEVSPGVNYEMIEVAEDEKLVFNSDIDNDGDIDEITWELTDTKVYDSDPSKNQNVKVLIRSQNGVDTEIRSGVKKFTINYYDEYGETKANRMSTPITDPLVRANIKQIDVELIIESKEKIRYSVNSDGRYVASAWEKRFTPRNLQD